MTNLTITVEQVNALLLALENQKQELLAMDKSFVNSFSSYADFEHYVKESILGEDDLVDAFYRDSDSLDDEEEFFGEHMDTLHDMQNENIQEVLEVGAFYLDKNLSEANEKINHLGFEFYEVNSYFDSCIGYHIRKIDSEIYNLNSPFYTIFDIEHNCVEIAKNQL